MRKKWMILEIGAAVLVAIGTIVSSVVGYKNDEYKNNNQNEEE